METLFFALPRSGLWYPKGDIMMDLNGDMFSIHSAVLLDSVHL